MLNNSNPYFRQVELLLAVMPLVGPETCFALKGGSAINLFVRDLPRLSVAELEETRRTLVDMVQDRLTEAQRKFLFSFKQGDPEWPLLSVPIAEHLPAVQWKLINIRRMTKTKHAAAAEKLKKILFG